jgi:hypothetical protein
MEGCEGSLGSELTHCSKGLHPAPLDLQHTLFTCNWLEGVQF